MNILGINAYHGDSSACLVKDGELICAIEEERIRRIKHWAGFPSESVKWCLEYARISPGQINYIAISRNPFFKLPQKALRMVCKRPSFAFLCARAQNYWKLSDINDYFKARVYKIEHHRAHLASSFFVSPFDEAAVVSVDGFGDFVSAMTGIGKSGQIKILADVEFPHSLGIFYSALTQYLGFWNYGDEYKVMGLSAYGKPAFLDKMREIVKLKNNGLFELDTSYFLHDTEGVEMTWLNDAPKMGKLFPDRLIRLLGSPRREEEELGQRFQDIAASLQAMYEEAFFHILNHLYKKTGLENLCLSGGCSQNSLANGKIYEKTKFKNVYVPPAGHDAGGAIGAAFYLWNQILKKPRTFVMNSPYWGPDFDSNMIRSAIQESQLKFEELNIGDLTKKIAQDIADGKIVGWFQGRTEWGPRALGNRSILVDPRKKEMQDTLNARIKKREWFRPFAPSILMEKTGEWFEDSHPVPFMEKVYKVRQEKRETIPAVVHGDGTGRLQTVDSVINPLYHKLIVDFNNLTGVPIVLNTSFNENEPIVNTPHDAIDCFVRVGMDALALGNFYVSKG